MMPISCVTLPNQGIEYRHGLSAYERLVSMHALDNGSLQPSGMKSVRSEIKCLLLKEIKHDYVE